MNTDKVFIAYTKDGKELFLYKKDKNTFINLLSENEEIIPIEEIDLSFLSLAYNLLDLKKHMLKYFIKRKYIKDREQELNTKDYLISLKVRVTNYRTWCTGTNMFNLKKHHYWELNHIKYDIYNYIDKEEVSFDTVVNVYKNLNNEKFYGYKNDNEPEKMYHIPNFENGKEYIIIEENLYNATNRAYLDKKTINEVAYKLRKTLDSN